MTSSAKRLLVALAKRGMTRADELDLSEAELAAAVADLCKMVDDDGRHVAILKTWHEADRITAVELTAPGRGLAAHVRP
jgi:hypothetical protein